MDDDVIELRRALALLDQGRAAVLATVTRTWGSAPRRVGSHLVVSDDGTFFGSVSGGCVEVAVIEAARQTLDDGRGRRLEFGVSDDDAMRVGLACGGRIEVWLEPAGPARAELQRVVAAVEARSAIARVVALDAVTGHVASFVWQADDAAPPGRDEHVVARLTELVANDESAIIELRSPDDAQPAAVIEHLFARAYGAPYRLIVVGAVHIASTLVALGRTLGYDVTLIDPRGAFARAARFPDIAVDDRWPDEALAALGVDARTAVVTLTHDPKLDEPALLAALGTDAFYIGALGSRKTHAGRTRRLADRGVSDAALARVHSPIGLDVGARTPAEIAVAVAAELIAARRRAPRPPTP